MFGCGNLLNFVWGGDVIVIDEILVFCVGMMFMMIDDVSGVNLFGM